MPSMHSFHTVRVRCAALNCDGAASATMDRNWFGEPILSISKSNAVGWVESRVATDQRYGTLFVYQGPCRILFFVWKYLPHFWATSRQCFGRPEIRNRKINNKKIQPFGLVLHDGLSHKSCKGVETSTTRQQMKLGNRTGYKQNRKPNMW